MVDVQLGSDGFPARASPIRACLRVGVERRDVRAGSGDPVDAT